MVIVWQGVLLGVGDSLPTQYALLNDSDILIMWYISESNETKIRNVEFPHKKSMVIVIKQNEPRSIFTDLNLHV